MKQWSFQIYGAVCEVVKISDRPVKCRELNAYGSSNAIQYYNMIILILAELIENLAKNNNCNEQINMHGDNGLFVFVQSELNFGMFI